MENLICPHGKLPGTLPRVGIVLRLLSDFETLTWYGDGPWETYPDRRSSGLIGLYRTSVTENSLCPYERPQEFGSREQVTALSVDNGRTAIAVAAHPALAMSALRVTPEAMVNAGHAADIAPCPDVVVSVDARQCGLGNRSCGPEVLPQYSVAPVEYTFAFMLIPFEPNGDMMTAVRFDLDTPNCRQAAADSTTDESLSSGYFDPSDSAQRLAAGFKND